MPMLSVVMPAYNEAANLEDAIQATRSALEASGVDWELIVVNDGSTDRSSEILSEYPRRGDERIRVETHARNQGFGAAIRTGIRAARGVFCMVVPADSPLTLETLRPFLEAMPASDLILGWRPERLGYTPLMRFNSWFYHVLLRLLFGLPYRDVNWQHLYRRSIFEQIDIETHGVVMGAEMAVKAHRLGLRVAEVPCPMRPRRGGVASASRPKVMLRTAQEFGRFFWRWHFGRREQAACGLLLTDAPYAANRRPA